MYKVITQKDEMGNIQSSLDYFLKFNLPKDAKILDIGCNYGSLNYNLYKLGYRNIFGIEIDNKAISQGKIFYPEIAHNLYVHKPSNIPFEDNTFDVVLMFDVIEHIPSVGIFLKNQVHRVLKSKGTFIFQTPNKKINIPWEIINNKSFTKWKEYHCSLQTPISLKKMLTDSTFTNIVIEKGNVLTQHNKEKVYKRIGKIGLLILYILQKLPLSINSNIWGHCQK